MVNRNKNLAALRSFAEKLLGQRPFEKCAQGCTFCTPFQSASWLPPWGRLLATVTLGSKHKNWRQIQTRTTWEFSHSYTSHRSSKGAAKQVCLGHGKWLNDVIVLFWLWKAGTFWSVAVLCCLLPTATDQSADLIQNHPQSFQLSDVWVWRTHKQNLTSCRCRCRAGFVLTGATDCKLL